MKLTYNGPHDAAEIPLPGKRPARVANGETVDLPAEVAKSLLGSDHWAAEKAAPKKAPKGQKDEA